MPRLDCRTSYVFARPFRFLCSAITGVGLLACDSAPTEPERAVGPDRVTFLRTRSGSGTYELRVVNADGTGDSAVAGVSSVAWYEWAPGGTLLAYLDNKRAGIHVFNVTTGTEVTIVPQFHGSHIIGLRWSPDATRLVFHSGVSVYVASADGTKLVVLDYDVDYAAFPAWSPDSRRVAWIRQAPAPDFRRRLWIINADGFGRREITVEGHALNPQWSPSGSHIAFDDGQSIWTVRSGGTGAQRILAPPCAPSCGTADEYEFPQWSPDGTRITGMQGDRVWIVNADGTGLIKLDAGGILPPRPLWSRSGNHIAFIGRIGNGAPDVHLIAPDGTGRRAVAASNDHWEDIHRWIP